MVEKSNTANSKKFHKKKRKHKVDNDENLSDCKILEINKQDLENNTGIEILKELNMHKKKHKHKSPGEREGENVSDDNIKVSGKTDNNIILNELYKQKRRHKGSDNDKKSDCLSSDLNEMELSQNVLSSEIVNCYKQKRKKGYKLVAEENLLKTDNLRLDHSSKNSVYSEDVEFIENSDSQSILKVSRKNKKRSEKNKKKHKVTDGENVSDYKIADTVMQNLKNDTCNKFLKGVRKQKNKKVDFKLGEMEKSNHHESAIDESKKSIQDVLEMHEKVGKHKKNKVDKIFDCKTTELNAIEINKNNLTRENGDKFNEKKNKYKILDEMEVLSDCQTAYLKLYEINQKNSNAENINRYHKKKKKKQKLDDEIEIISDCKTGCLSPVEVYQKNSNAENINRFHEKKKKKRKLGDKIEIMSDCKTAHLNPVEINQKNSNAENINRFHEKKKKKHKLDDVIENIYDCKTAELNAIEMHQNHLSRENIDRFHEEKSNNYKLLNEMENLYDCKAQCLNPVKINQNNLHSKNDKTFHEKKKKKHKHKLLDKIKNISDSKLANSDSFEINQNALNSKNACRFHEKKHKLKLLNEMENINDCKTDDLNVIELNLNDLNKFHKKKKRKHGHKLFDEMDNKSNDKIQESAMYEAEQNKILETLHIQKINKCKSSDVAKIPYETIDSKGIEINHNDSSSETFIELHKAKRKKNIQNLAEVKKMSKTVPESINSLDLELEKEVKDKSLQNSVADIPSPDRKNKKLVESKNEISKNLKEKENNASYKVSGKNYQENIYISFDPFINDVTDVPVSFIVPLLHEGETVASITQEKKAYLEKHGVIIHNGKWTKTEDDILTRNFQQFGLKFGVNNPFQLLGINQYKKDDKLEKFKKAKHFLIRLGKDLNNRSLRSIYMRARKLLTPFKNGEKLTAEETADLKHAYQLVGNKWTRISEMLLRSDNTCHTAFRWHKSDINKGKWTPEEENNLINAIKSVSGAEDISANNLMNISWKDIAKYVNTRNEFQCHKQWAEHLAWDISVSERKDWERYHYGKLIYLLKEKYCFKSEHEVDWRELHKHFKDVAPSYIYLHKKWFYLKSRVPKEFNLSYSKCLDAFKNMYEEEYKIFADEKLL